MSDSVCGLGQKKAIKKQLVNQLILDYLICVNSELRALPGLPLHTIIPKNHIVELTNINFSHVNTKLGIFPFILGHSLKMKQKESKDRIIF